MRIARFNSAKMPNVILCTLEITRGASPEGFAKLKERIQTEGFSYKMFVPLPEGGDPRKLWNTTMEAGEVEITYPKKNKIVITFESAWEPPTPVVDAMFDQYGCRLRLEYEDPDGDDNAHECDEDCAEDCTEFEWAGCTCRYLRK